MAEVHVMDHPLIQHKINFIRRKEVGSKDFRSIVGEIAALMCYEATRDLKLQDVEIETPICKMVGKELSGKKLAVVPILRAGLGMVDGMLNMIPAAKVGHIGLYRDPETFKPVEYYCKLPADCDEPDAGDGRIQFSGNHHAEGKRRKAYPLHVYSCSPGRRCKDAEGPSRCGSVYWRAGRMFE